MGGPERPVTTSHLRPQGSLPPGEARVQASGTAPEGQTGHRVGVWGLTPWLRPPSPHRQHSLASTQPRSLPIPPRAGLCGRPARLAPVSLTCLSKLRAETQQPQSRQA